MQKISPTLKTIKQEMERQEVSIYELADAVGVARSTLYRVFNGEFVPSFEVIENLVKALRMRIIVKR